MELTRVLVVQEPWASLLVDGVKIWELRRKPTRVRGPIGIAVSGSSQVIGSIELVACHGPFHPSELEAQFDKHRVTREFLSEYSGGSGLWAWEVADGHRFSPPVDYDHPQGAVIWVKLDPPLIYRT